MQLDEVLVRNPLGGEIPTSILSLDARASMSQAMYAEIETSAVNEAAATLLDMPTSIVLSSWIWLVDSSIKRSRPTAAICGFT
jgi:hypothetical protein